jgi:SNF2 family DNA or RNA helicase
VLVSFQILHRLFFGRLSKTDEASEECKGFQRMKWGRIIIDEAQEVSNAKTKTFKALMRIRSDIGGTRWIISGNH